MLVLYVFLVWVCVCEISSQILTKPTINNLTALGSGPNSIELHWNIVDGDDLLYYFVDYTPRKIRKQIMAPATSFNFEGLEAATEYSFEIFGLGILANSDKVVANSSTCDGVPSQVTDVKLVSIKATSITMSWKAPLVQNGKADGYHVSVWTPGGQPTGEDVTVMEHEFTGLQPGLSYYVTIAAKNVQTPCGGGTGKEVLKGLYYMQSVSSVPAPRDSTITLASGTVHMQWTHMTVDELRNIMAYKYELAKTRRPDFVIQKGTISKTDTSLSLFNLDPFTPYQLTVFTIGIYSRNGVTQTFTTPPGKPLPVWNLETDLQIDFIDVRWQPPVEVFGKLDKYRVTLFNGNYIERQEETTLNNHTFKNLNPENYYAVSVEASFQSVNNLGGGYGLAEKTELQQFYFTFDFVLEPNLLAAKAVGATAVRLNWETPEDWHLIYQYRVLINSSHDFKSVIVPTFPSQRTVTGLTPSTEYTVRLQPFSLLDGESESNSLKFTTARGVPSTVQDFVANQTDLMPLTLTWKPPVTGTPDSYRFFWMNSGDQFHALGECDGTETSYSVPAVMPATQPITFFVQAYHAPDGEGLGGGYGSMTSSLPIDLNSSFIINIPN